MKIWLDDEREPPTSEWVWMDSSQAVIDALCKLNVTEVSLDHDLGDEEMYGNGYKVLLWIEQQVYLNNKYIPPMVEIHTANPVARMKMRACRASIRRRLLSRQ
jgi:hypothetical protein